MARLLKCIVNGLYRAAMLFSRTQAEREIVLGEWCRRSNPSPNDPVGLRLRFNERGPRRISVTFCHRLMLLPRHIAVWPRPCQAEHRLPLHAFSPRYPNDRDSALASRSSCSNSRGNCSGACASAHQRRPTVFARSAGQGQRSNSSVCSGARICIYGPKATVCPVLSLPVLEAC